MGCRLSEDNGDDGGQKSMAGKWTNGQMGKWANGQDLLATIDEAKRAEKSESV